MADRRFPSPSMIAESTCPTSSCNSREIRRRSLSCAETNSAESPLSSSRVLTISLNRSFASASSRHPRQRHPERDRKNQQEQQPRPDGLEHAGHLITALVQLALADLLRPVRQTERAHAPRQQFFLHERGRALFTFGRRPAQHRGNRVHVGCELLRELPESLFIAGAHERTVFRGAVFNLSLCFEKLFAVLTPQRLVGVQKKIANMRPGRINARPQILQNALPRQIVPANPVLTYANIGESGNGADPEEPHQKQQSAKSEKEYNSRLPVRKVIGLQ